jgi:hypothetical protein
LGHLNIFYIICTNYKHPTQTYKNVIKWYVSTNIITFMLAEKLY